MQNLIVSDISINFNNGLYSLNDLHKASGSDMNNQPSNFLKLDSTKALAREISFEINQSYDSMTGVVEVSRGGTSPGTFVCKELVYAYAMWISPAFNLKVIRAFDAMATQQPQFKLPQTLPEALRALADEVEAHEKTKAELEIAKPKAEYFDALVDRNLLTNFRDTAKELGLKQTDFINKLLERGFVFRDASSNLKPYAQHTPELFELKEWKNDSKSGVQTLITPRGRETFRLLLCK